MNTWYCPKCGRDGFSPRFTAGMHARHCRPPTPFPLRLGSPSERYRWHYKLWRAEQASPDEAFAVHLEFAHWRYRLERAQELCAR